MSFTLRIIEELVAHEYDKTCCKKALLFGLFFAAERLSKKEVKAEFKTEQSAALAASILKKQFSAEPCVTSGVRAGRNMFWVSVSSKAIALYLDRIDREESDGSEGLGDIVGFRCQDCAKAFLAGVFVATGIATDPAKRYSLEFGIKSEARAALLSDFLCANVGSPSCVDRRTRIGLYYKGNEAITDVFTYIGAYRASYAVIDAFMTHGIKNNENRATNCVLRNIEKSVSAIRRHIDAIEKLRANGRFELLDEDLKYTALLRCEHDSATLAELAALHEPSISKSGINKRLERLLSLADEIE